MSGKLNVLIFSVKNQIIRQKVRRRKRKTREARKKEGERGEEESRERVVFGGDGKTNL